MKFRTLKADEIEVRIASINEHGVNLLLYKNARVDQAILDETVGAENWENSYQLINGCLYCTVSIWSESKKQWISKQNVGTESNTEKEKGQASDAFKRACFNWGIGRELYTRLDIFATKDKVNIKPRPNGGYACYDKFYVEYIKVENDKIVGISIVNETTRKRVYVLPPPENKSCTGATGDNLSPSGAGRQQYQQR